MMLPGRAFPCLKGSRRGPVSTCASRTTRRRPRPRKRWSALPWSRPRPLRLSRLRAWSGADPQWRTLSRLAWQCGEIGMILSRPRGGADDGGHRWSIAYRSPRCARCSRSIRRWRSLRPHRRHRLFEGSSHSSWIADAAFELRATIQLLETVFDPQTIILCGGMPSGLARLLMDALHPLLPSIAERRQRSAPRLQTGFHGPVGGCDRCRGRADQSDLRSAFFGDPEERGRGVALSATGAANRPRK